MKRLNQRTFQLNLELEWVSLNGVNSPSVIWRIRPPAVNGFKSAFLILAVQPLWKWMSSTHPAAMPYLKQKVPWDCQIRVIKRVFKGLPHRGFRITQCRVASQCILHGEREWNKVLWKRRTLGRHNELAFKNGKWLHLQNRNFSDRPDHLMREVVHPLGNRSHMHAQSLVH